MSNDMPPEAAYDASGNPLFSSDGNLASAADAARFNNAKLYVGGEKLHEGDVFDGWGHKVRSGGSGAGSTSWGDSSPASNVGDEIADVIGVTTAAVVMAAFVLLTLRITGPLDRWLLQKAKQQTIHPEELEPDIVNVSGLNLGGLLNLLVWPFFFLRLRFALVVSGLTFLPLILFIIPCLWLIFPLLTCLVIVRGNEWAWYSGRWDTVESFREAKRRWIMVGSTITGLLILAALLAT